MKVSFIPAIERPTDASLKNMKTAEIRPSTAIVILSMPAGEQRRCRTKGLSTETRNNGRTARELLQARWTGNLFSLDRLFHRRGAVRILDTPSDSVQTRLPRTQGNMKKQRPFLLWLVNHNYQQERNAANEVYWNRRA